MSVLGAFNQLAILIVFSNTPALNVVTDIVRHFANNASCFIYRYQFEIICHKLTHYRAYFLSPYYKW